jgi:hypothetical protein
MSMGPVTGKYVVSLFKRGAYTDRYSFLTDA